MMQYEEIENLTAYGRGLLNELRQKPTVEAGIVARETTMGRTFIEYQPGNGTRYVFLFVEIVGMPKLTEHAGANPHSWLVMDTIHNSAYLFAAHGFIAPQLVKEKLGRNEVDSVVVAELIAHVIDRSAFTCEEYLRSVHTEQDA